MCNILYALMDPAMIVPTEHQEMVVNPMAWAGPITEWKAVWGTPTSTWHIVNSTQQWTQVSDWALLSTLIFSISFNQILLFHTTTHLSTSLDTGSIDSDEQHSTDYCHPWPWPHPNKILVLQIQVLQPFWMNQLISVLCTCTVILFSYFRWML